MISQPAAGQAAPMLATQVATCCLKPVKCQLPLAHPALWDVENNG